MKVAGLFAGIGGLELGLSAAGHQSLILCEIWEPARAVLSRQFPGIPVAANIIDLKVLPEETEVIVAGFRAKT